MVPEKIKYLKPKRFQMIFNDVLNISPISHELWNDGVADDCEGGLACCAAGGADVAADAAARGGEAG